MTSQIPEGMSGPSPSAGSGTGGGTFAGAINSGVGIPEGMSGPRESVIADWQALSVINPAGRTTTISYGYAVSMGWAPSGLTLRQYSSGGWANRIQRAYYDWSLNPTGGGGGGRGVAGPTYQAPDSATVRENMKAYVVAVTGTADKDLIERATNEYLAKDKARFQASDAPQDIDPLQAAYGVVRNSAQYKTIHTLRPDSVDEMEWVVDRQAKLRQLGLSGQSAERLGIKQAQAGATDEALVAAAGMQFNADTGRLLAVQRDGLKRSASAALRLIR